MSALHQYGGARPIMLDLTERLAAQSIHAISRRAATPADSFEAWRFLDESATAAAALPHTREAYLFIPVASVRY
ncbi:hypothetical protein LMTR13_08360 [Bradyrhizobium icense]|uniref:Uncharacterized protein n=1 Tax=Bradyrhizobium icense TaxID=1274631 RepID=A0A1B1UBP0_9BRAD|nr:hypothetical protein LMTR13_08360 [Bradyrhizobium icense]